MFTDDGNPEQKTCKNAWCTKHVPPVVLSMKKALTVPSGNCGKAAFLLCRGWKHGRMSSSKSLRGDLLRGLGYKGAGGGRGYKGCSWTFTQLGLKERNLQDSKEAPPHWAVQCFLLHPLSALSRAARRTAGLRLNLWLWERWAVKGTAPVRITLQLIEGTEDGWNDQRICDNNF